MKKLFKIAALSLLSILRLILLLIASLVAIEYFGDQPMGIFAGTRPDGLGFCYGKFKPPSAQPNTVSSTVATEDTHYIAPLAFDSDAAIAWKKLATVVGADTRAKIITISSNYLYAEYKSVGLGFVDDVEFSLDEKNNVIQVRSGARLGVRDFNVNRKRIETLRMQLNK